MSEYNYKSSDEMNVIVSMRTTVTSLSNPIASSTYIIHRRKPQMLKNSSKKQL